MSLEYVGDGEWIPGVPARDLSDEEAEQHAQEISDNERATGRILYAPASEDGGEE